MVDLTRVNCRFLESTSAENEFVKGLYRLSFSALEYEEVDDLRKGILPVMEDLFDAQSSSFFLTQGPDYRLNLDRIINRNIPQKYSTQYREHYHEQDPFFKQPGSFGTVATIEQLVALNELEKTSFYNDFLCPQSIYHGMCIYLSIANKLLGAIFVCRPKDANAFDTMDQNKALLVAPILVSALERTILKNRIDQHQKIVNFISPALPYKAVLAFDEYMEPIYMYGDLTDFLSAFSQGEKQEKSKSYSLPEIRRICEDLARSAMKNNDNYCDSACILPIKTDKQEMLSNLSYLKDAKIFLLTVNEKNSLRPLIQVLKAFGFTRREQEVIELVCRGFKNRQIADKLFISKRTVENHLRAIFEKAGVDNRTRLAHFVTDPDSILPTDIRL